MEYPLLRALPWAAALMALSGAAGAANIPTLEEGEIEYEAPRECPNATAFLSEVNRRASGSRPIRIDAAFRLVRVRVETEDGRAHGVVSIREPNGDFAERRVEATNCREVTTALALVTSVAFESESNPLDLPPPQSAPLPGVAEQPSEPDPASDEPPPSPDEAEATTDPTPAQVFAGSFPARGNDPTAATESAEGWLPMSQDRNSDSITNVFGPRTPYGWWSIGAHVGVIAGPLPETVVSPSLFVDARIDPTDDWTPSARLSAKRALYDSGSADDRVDMAWTAGRADLCPMSTKVAEPEVRLWPCGTFEAALLSARGTTSATAAGDHSPQLYFSTGAVARLQWILLDVLLLEAEAGAAVPLSRPDLGNGGNSALKVAGLQSYASAGFGGRFP
jgi:hypothetical protein